MSKGIGFDVKAKAKVKINEIEFLVLNEVTRYNNLGGMKRRKSSSYLYEEDFCKFTA